MVEYNTNSLFSFIYALIRIVTLSKTNSSKSISLDRVTVQMKTIRSFRNVCIYSLTDTVLHSNDFVLRMCSATPLTFQSLAVSLRTTTFNIQELYVVLALRCWVFCTDIRTDSDFCFIHHRLMGFYNRGRKCLLRGTDWFLIYIRLRFVFKRLIILHRCTSRRESGSSRVSMEPCLRCSSVVSDQRLHTVPRRRVKLPCPHFSCYCTGGRFVPDKYRTAQHPNWWLNWFMDRLDRSPDALCTSDVCFITLSH